MFLFKADKMNTIGILYPNLKIIFKHLYTSHCKFDVFSLNIWSIKPQRLTQFLVAKSNFFLSFHCQASSHQQIVNG